MTDWNNAYNAGHACMVALSELKGFFNQLEDSQNTRSLSFEIKMSETSSSVYDAWPCCLHHVQEVL